jgi:hypothetical protein
MPVPPAEKETGEDKDQQDQEEEGKPKGRKIKGSTYEYAGEDRSYCESHGFLILI